MNKLKLWRCLILLAGPLVACGPKMPLQWQEEVLLSDGRMLLVERTASMKGLQEWGGPGGMKDQRYSLQFTLPDGKPAPRWNGVNMPMIFDYNPALGGWYLISNIAMCEEWQAAGRPNPPYVAYRLQDNAWKRIRIDPRLYGKRFNMQQSINYKDGMPKLVTLQIKEKQEWKRWSNFDQAIQPPGIDEFDISCRGEIIGSDGKELYPIEKFKFNN